MNRHALAVAAALALVASPAAAAHWNVDYAKSRLGFSVQWSGEPFSAEFRRWSADIEFDPDDLPHARVSVAVDLTSEASDEADFDSGLKGAQGFETSLFPTARFATRGFGKKAPGSYAAQGTLTIRGIARDVTLPFSLTISGRTAHMTGTVHIVRTEFGVGRGEWAAPTPVAHDVSVNIDLTATRQGS